MSMLARVTKLESRHQTGGDIPVWCDQPTDMPGAIAEMIAAGEIIESDRPRCVYWAQARLQAGLHEAALEEMA